MSATITREQVETVTYETLEELGAEREALRPDATFEELDVDSLDLAELGQVVEERFGVTLKGDDVANIRTVGEAIDLVVARSG